MIFNVRGLDDELKAVRLNAGSMLDISRFGYIPRYPEKRNHDDENRRGEPGFQPLRLPDKKHYPEQSADGRKRNNEQDRRFQVIVV